MIILLCVLNAARGQSDHSSRDQTAFTLSGFLDVFYAYDFNKPEGNSRQPFFFNHNRHNEFNLNLGLIKFDVDHEKYRARLGLQTGTYPNDNYAAEPGLLKNLFEATAGVSLNQKNSLWLDAGILPSHIGFESAISTQNLTLTRGILAENSPYFLTGAKVTYTPNDTWEFATMVVNGWQVIQRVEGNSLPSFGTQISAKANSTTTINWSTFIGTTDPDATRRMRYYSDLYAIIGLSDRLTGIIAFDIGWQQVSKGSSNHDLWYSPNVLLQYQIDDQWKVAGRIEYFDDKAGVIIPTGSTNSFKTMGYSINLDFLSSPAVTCRIEARYLGSVDPVFEEGNTLSDRNFFISSSIAISLPKRMIRR